MRLTELITEVGYEVDRVSIDDRVKFWIQQAIDMLYISLPSTERQRTATLTTVNGQQSIAVSKDFSEVIGIYNTAKEALGFLSFNEFFAKNRHLTSGTPEVYTFFQDQLLFAPVPNAAVNLTLHYSIEKPSIYVHNLTIEHQGGLPGAYVPVYLDEDGIAVGEGKLYCVSPTLADILVSLQTIDGHIHEVTVYHNTNAATLGVAWYFNESQANAWERNYFISPTKSNTIVKTSNKRKHHHFLNFLTTISASYPSSNNTQVYISQVNNSFLRLAFISPTLTNGTNELVHTADNELPGFLEKYHNIIFELAVAKGLRFNKNYEWADQHMKIANALIALAIGKGQVELGGESAE